MEAHRKTALAFRGEEGEGKERERERERETKKGRDRAAGRRLTGKTGVGARC